MGINAIVFEEGAAPKPKSRSSRGPQIDALPLQKASGENPENSSTVLNLWFDEMREKFPLPVYGAPDESRAAEYCFYKNFIEMMFAGSIGEEGVVTAWRLAEKRGLRVLVSGELLPRSAPERERRSHVTVDEYFGGRTTLRKRKGSHRTIR